MPARCTALTSFCVPIVLDEWRWFFPHCGWLGIFCFVYSIYSRWISIAPLWGRWELQTPLFPRRNVAPAKAEVQNLPCLPFCQNGPKALPRTYQRLLSSAVTVAQYVLPENPSCDLLMHLPCAVAKIMALDHRALFRLGHEQQSTSNYNKRGHR